MPDVVTTARAYKRQSMSHFQENTFAMDPKKERVRELRKRQQEKYRAEKKAPREYLEQENVKLKKRVEELLKHSDYFKRQFPKHWQVVQLNLGDETAQRPTQELCQI